MKDIRGARKTFCWVSVFALAGSLLSSYGSLAAETGDCERLHRSIAEAARSGQSTQYQAAAERQRSEIDRTAAFAREIGCDNKKFLFFGSDPPAQCGQVRAQLGRMRANLESLQAHVDGGSSGRAELIARYNAQCGSPSRPSGLVEALFGQPHPGELEEQPLSPDFSDRDKGVQEKSASPVGEARAGGKAVCVRSCDGAFFPVSYSAGSGRLDQLADICRALCPNAEVTLYTYPLNGEIEQAVSINGVRYMDSPTALRYRKTFDSSCACRHRGQSWASVLGPAEILLGQEDKADIIVTPEKAAELSRPKGEAKTDSSKRKSGKATNAASPSAVSGNPGDASKVDTAGVDNVLRDAAANISRDTSGIAGSAESLRSNPMTEDQGRILDETTPEGQRRKVRVIGN